MPDQLAELQESVDRLLAIEEIKHLKARYFRLLDQQLWDEFLNVFTDDAHFVIEADPGITDVYESPQGFLDAILARRGIDSVVTIHTGHTPEIDLLSPDSARGTWSMYDYVDFVGDTQRIVKHGYGYYIDTYRRLNGEWLIASLTLERIRRDVVPAHLHPELPNGRSR